MATSPKNTRNAKPDDASIDPEHEDRPEDGSDERADLAQHRPHTDAEPNPNDVTTDLVQHRPAAERGK